MMSGNGGFTGFETLTFEVDNFADFKTEENGCNVGTDTIQGHGLSWWLDVWPQGEKPCQEGWICVDLYCSKRGLSDKKVNVNGAIQIGSSVYKSFEHTFHAKSCYFEADKVAKISDAVSTCLEDDGKLVIRVLLQFYKERKTWYPKPLEKNNVIEQLLESPLGSDISFSVGEKKEKFHAHKCIFIHRAPILYDIIKDIAPGGEFEIPDISGPIFKCILVHIYTNSLPEIRIDDIETAKALLFTTDRYALIHMKLHVESVIVDKLLQPSNACEWLLTADGRSCPLLKEECMEMYIKNATKVMSSSGWLKVRESRNLLEELLTFSYVRREPNDSNDYDNLPVGTLREKLDSIGLDLDGTRSMLIQRLKDHRVAASTAVATTDTSAGTV